MTFLRWLNPTGGLRYHLRALRYRARWEGYVAGVARWLRAWAPPEDRLVLVGPSAGYSLDATFLTSFRALFAVDPDPIARALFQRRFGPALRAAGTTLTWDTRDYLSPGPRGFDPAGMHALLSLHPGAAVLFCNVLGQLRLLDPDDAFRTSFEMWKSALPDLLAGRSWASYHDRLSGPIAPVVPEGFRAPDAMSNEELGEAFYVTDALVAEDASPIEIVEHGTADLFPGRPREYLVWEILPQWHHLIEWVSCSVSTEDVELTQA